MFSKNKNQRLKFASKLNASLWLAIEFSIARVTRIFVRFATENRKNSRPQTLISRISALQKFLAYLLLARVPFTLARDKSNFSKNPVFKKPDFLEK